jgi:hypothetical protein
MESKKLLEGDNESMSFQKYLTMGTKLTRLDSYKRQIDLSKEDEDIDESNRRPLRLSYLNRHIGDDEDTIILNKKNIIMIKNIEEEEEEEGKEEDESAKEIDTPSTTTTMDEVKEKEEEKPTDVTTKEVEIKEEEQREQPAAASSVEREETKGEAPREGDEREQRIAEDDLTTPKSFVEFTAKDREDVERFDYMMQKRDGSIGLSKNQCQEVKTYFQETLKPRYEDLKTNRIVIIDWSENYQNGIGDEMQHYQELFIIAALPVETPMINNS